MSKSPLLLSNCSEYRPNNSTNIQRYCTVICISRKPACHTGRRPPAKLSHSPPFTAKFINYSSWIINLLLDVLVCSIALYF